MLQKQMQSCLFKGSKGGDRIVAWCLLQEQNLVPAILGKHMGT